jgi:uncharacterized protein (TIGR03437 family)
MLKRLNRLLTLGFLGALGSQLVSAQALTSIRIGINEEAARFLVDGQVFNQTQNFVWPEGSTHIVEFFQSYDAGDPQPYQYHPGGNARYIFRGWAVKSSVPFELPAGNVVRLTAARTLTELIGTVTKQFPFDLIFPQASPDPSCSAVLDVPMLDRAGVLVIDGNCYSQSKTIWMTPGVHTFQAHAYPGYYFRGAVMDRGLQEFGSRFDLRIDATSGIRPVFERSKRVRFSTNPSRLQVLVDRTPVTPQVYFSVVPETVECAKAGINLMVPAGIAPLCIGDYDFVPGSVHQLGAQEVQSDPEGDLWIFSRWSNGLGQNGLYTTPGDTHLRDDIQAIFIHGVRASIDTNVAGLKVLVDGKDAPPDPRYGYVWAEGSTHRLSAPLLQRDAKGRMWKFVRWADGGERERDVTVAVAGHDFRATAHFEVLGQVQVTTVPAGLAVKVNGADCNTPCTFDQDAGTTIDVAAAKNLALGEGSRYDFEGWLGLTPALTHQATFTSSVQILTAQYHGSHRILAYADPEEGAKFRLNPESTDGFYAEGTSVEVTVLPNTGFKFLRWEQDLTSRTATDRLSIVGPMSVVARMEKVPAISSAGIRNAAGDTPDGSVAPGSIIAIYGENLTDALEIGPSNPLAQAIGDIYVTVNDRLLPLIFVSPQQINAQLLSSLGEGEYTLTVHHTGRPGVSGTFRVKRNAPGVFYNLTPDGMPLVAALHQDGTPVTQASPARKGETISIFGTGLGGYDRPVIDGFILPDTEVYRLLDPVKIVAGVPGSGAPAGANAADAPVAVRDPAFAGGAAGMVGTSLVKIALDAELPAGSVLELFLSVNGADSNRVQLPVE